MLTMITSMMSSMITLLMLPARVWKIIAYVVVGFVILACSLFVGYIVTTEVRMLLVPFHDA